MKNKQGAVKGSVSRDKAFDVSIPDAKWYRQKKIHSKITQYPLLNRATKVQSFCVEKVGFH